MIGKERILRTINAANLIVLILLFSGGCEPGLRSPVPQSERSDDILCGYAAETVHIVGLTEMVKDPGGDDSVMLKIYMELWDKTFKHYKDYHNNHKLNPDVLDYLEKHLELLAIQLVKKD